MNNPEYRYEDQPYIRPLRALGEKIVTTGKPGLHHVVVEHDGWCPALAGAGLCICAPVVRVANRAERRRLRKVGRL